MASRGVPFHPDAEQSFQLALKRIRVYKGSKPVFDEETRLLVQSIVIDALIVAPQPVTGGWVHTSLMTVGGLVRWAMFNGEALDRDHLLSTHTRNRFLNLGCKHLEDSSVTNYRTRLDLIATALSGVPIAPTTTRVMKHGEPVDPHPPGEVATLWVWAEGLRPAKRRDRLIAVIALGLGCGLRSSEQIGVSHDDVLIDEQGVHVTVRSKYGTRVVTCDRVWEDRLAHVVANTAPGHLLTSPWRSTPATGRGLQNAVRSAQREYPPPVWFSPRSLRNTWLVERMALVPTLMDAAGVESIEALKAFLPFVPALTGNERAAVLRARR